MDDKLNEESLSRLKESMLESQVEATLGGHDFRTPQTGEESSCVTKKATSLVGQLLLIIICFFVIENKAFLTVRREPIF